MAESNDPLRALMGATQKVIEETEGMVVPPTDEEVTPAQDREYVVLIGGDLESTPVWVELGTVFARNRSEAIENAEAGWPNELDGDVKVHLVPGRFWKVIEPEKTPPPPPKRKWLGL